MANIFRVSHISQTYFRNWPYCAYHYHEKYLLSVTVIQHLLSGKNAKIDFSLKVIIQFYF